MSYFPINLDVRERKVVVVGGGAVARRKAEALLACGALVTVVSPTVCPELAVLPIACRIERDYRTGDLAGACLVISATDDEAANRQVCEDALESGIPCNVVDCPELCSFTVPAVLRRGALTVTVSTGGISPSLAGRVRRQLESELSPAIEAHLRLLAEMRPRVKASALAGPDRSRLLKAMAGEDISAIIERKGAGTARRCLQRMFDEALAGDSGP
jgi:precorrin-2 dehydrogenase/sirohydrochlorin ferrochelatase